MPEHLKNAPNSKEFEKYLQKFMRRKELQHSRKVFTEAAKSLVLAVTI